MCRCVLPDKMVHDTHDGKLHCTRVRQTIVHDYAIWPSWELCTCLTSPLPGLGGRIWMPLVNGTGNSPVSRTADPRSSQTGQVIRGLR